MRYLTAGFSHGSGYVGIIEGLPSGLEIDEGYINAMLMRRQSGQGRSERMEIERDTVKILSGLINGATVGAAVAFSVRNLMHDRVSFTTPRPGHADFAGALKYNHTDLSMVAEASSGRETVMATVVGAICKQLLNKLSINLSANTVSILGQTNRESFAQIIENARAKGDTVGGKGEVIIKGVIAGFGSCVARDRRLDGKLAAAIMSIPSVKSVEFGLGTGYETAFGSESLDKITVNRRTTNFAGGIEGGMTNGEDIVVRFAVKPPATVPMGMASIDLNTCQPAVTQPLRGDTCITESVTAVAECVCAYELANEILFSLGGDTIGELIERYENKQKAIMARLNG